jgi:transcriptional regulator with XRE-family HTH domain
MNEPISRRKSKCIVHNRIAAVLMHTSWYAFRGTTRLAADAGVSHTTISRIIDGKSNPTFAVMSAITGALENRLNRRLDPRELVSLDGTYPTPTVCELMACSGCLPDAVYDEENEVRSHFKNVKAGHWDLKSLEELH